MSPILTTSCISKITFSLLRFLSALIFYNDVCRIFRMVFLISHGTIHKTTSTLI